MKTMFEGEKKKKTARENYSKMLKRATFVW